MPGSCWWEDAFLAGSDDEKNRFFLEAAQTLPLLIEHPTPADIIDAIKMHRIRLAKDQGLRPWEPRRDHHPPLMLLPLTAASQ